MGMIRDIYDIFSGNANDDSAANLQDSQQNFEREMTTQAFENQRILDEENAKNQAYYNRLAAEQNEKYAQGADERQLRNSIKLGNINNQYAQAADQRQFNNSLALGEQNNEYALRAMQKEYSLNEKAADAADERQRAQYNDLQSYTARKEDMLNAGLNPAMMMASGGGSGMSVPQAAKGGASGEGGTAGGGQGTAGRAGGGQGTTARMDSTRYPTGAETAMAANGRVAVGLQQEALKSQIQNTKANTLATLAQAGLKPLEGGKLLAGIKNLNKDTDVKSEQILDIIAGVKNKEVQREGYKLENATTEWELEYKKETKDINVALLNQRMNESYRHAEMMLEEARGQRIENSTRRALNQQTIAYMKARTTDTIAAAALKNSQKELNNEQRKVIEDYLEIASKNQKANESYIKQQVRNMERTYKWMPAMNIGSLLVDGAKGLAGLGLAF